MGVYNYYILLYVDKWAPVHQWQWLGSVYDVGMIGSGVAAMTEF